VRGKIFFLNKVAFITVFILSYHKKIPLKRGGHSKKQV